MPKARSEVRSFPPLWNFKTPFPSPKFPQVRSHVPLSIERGSLRVRTLSTRQDLDAVFRLRYRVFHREYRQVWFPFGMDTDAFDEGADHILLEDLKTGKIVGTYRVRCSLFTDKFYSQTEFDLASLILAPGIKVELSRACIGKEFRKGPALQLLWRGVAQYFMEVGAKYVFGCSSVKTLEPATIHSLINEMKGKGYSLDEFPVHPHPEFQLPPDSTVDLQKAEAIGLPPLLQSYLRAGAKVALSPALDKEFRCTDFFTVLSVNSMRGTYARKFL